MSKPPKTPDTRMEIHKKKITDLQAKLKIQQARLGHLAAKKRTDEERKRTRQKIIVGAAFLTDATMHPDRLEYLVGTLRRSVVTERDKTAIAEIMAGDLSAFIKSDDTEKK